VPSFSKASSNEGGIEVLRLGRIQKLGKDFTPGHNGPIRIRKKF